MSPWGKLEQLSREETLSLQNKKLHTFINQYLYPFSPYYKKLFDDNRINPKHIRTVRDLAKIPLTSKRELVSTEANPEVFKDFILQPDKEKIKKAWPASKLVPMIAASMIKGSAYSQQKLQEEFRPVFMTFTTGTTNKPVPFLYTNYDIGNLYTSGGRMMSLFDTTNDQQIINMFPYAPHLAFWQVVFGGFSACTLALSTGGGKVLGTQGNIAAIQKMKPALVLGVPSYVYHVLRVAHEQGVKMEYVKKVVLGASKVTQAFKLKLIELLTEMGAGDVSVFGTYGFTEARCAWAECPTSSDVSSGYHLYPDKEVFEIIDPETGEVKKEGEDGELVYTSLDSRASSMLRYRTGDFVKGGITYEPCPHCRRQVPRISSDITRLSDVKDLQLSKIKGALVDLSHFATIIGDIKEVDEWQVEISKKNNDPFEIDEVNIFICAQNNCDHDALTQHIKKQMVVATEVAPNTVCFIPMDEMVKRLGLETENKEKRILDLRPKD